jgi:hypothetical protein
MNECPECSAPLKRGKCPGCGWQSSPDPTAKAADPDAGRCAWRNGDGRRCTLPRSYTPSTTGAGPWYCDFHASALRAPRMADDLEEFERWRAVTKDYCTIWQHYPALALWAWLRGGAAGPDDEPQPCAFGERCAIRLEQRGRGKAQARRRPVGALVERLVRGMDPNLPRGAK